MLMDAECPLGHHKHDMTTAHCGEIGCKCECPLCVRRRMFWEQAAGGHLRVLGGPSDGIHVSAASVGNPVEQQVVSCVAGAGGWHHLYQRKGNTLVHVALAGARLAVFRGGPYDGDNYPLDKLEVQEGVKGIFPLSPLGQPDMYAVYLRQGTELIWEGTHTKEEMQRLIKSGDVPF